MPQTKPHSFGASPRELEIWRRISRGERRKQIAFEMGIDVKTLDAHKAHLAAKLGIKGENAAMLTRAWFECGMEEKDSPSLCVISG